LAGRRPLSAGRLFRGCPSGGEIGFDGTAMALLRGYDTDVSLIAPTSDPTIEEARGMSGQPDPLCVGSGRVEYNVPQNKDLAMWRLKEGHELNRRTGYSRCRWVGGWVGRGG